MYENYTGEILDSLNIDWKTLAYSKDIKLTYGELIQSLLKNRSIKASCLELGISERTLERITSSALTHLCNKDSTNAAPWRTSLLQVINRRICYKCKQCLLISTNFVDRSTCKVCDSNNRKEARKLDPELYRERSKSHYKNNKHYYIIKASGRKEIINRATPMWASLVDIENIYNLCPIGYHVDHIIPLQGKNVSGLHVENNLQYLTAAENYAKSNSFTDTE